MHIHRFVSSIVVAVFPLLASACSAAPDADPGPIGSTSEAACTGGSGCGACRKDSSSPTGGTQTCWVCAATYKRDCTPPPAPPPPIPVPEILGINVTNWTETSSAGDGIFQGQAFVTISVPANCELLGDIGWGFPNETYADRYGPYSVDNFQVTGPTTFEQGFAFYNVSGGDWINVDMTCMQGAMVGHTANASIKPWGDDYESDP